MNKMKENSQYKCRKTKPKHTKNIEEKQKSRKKSY